MSNEVKAGERRDKSRREAVSRIRVQLAREENECCGYGGSAEPP